MKRPIDQLADLYRQYSPHRDMFDDIETFIIYHYVFSTPESIMLAKPVPRYAYDHEIIDPLQVFTRPSADCWFIFAYAGPKKDLLAFMPFELKWVAWQRKGVRLRYWTLEHFRKHAL